MGVSNTLQIKRTKPSVTAFGNGVRIVHKELVSTVFAATTIGSTAAFSSGQSVFQVNAACGSAFPWLSSIAPSYDKYRFRRLKLVYVPMCATNSIGRVTLLYDPDSTDPIPLERQSLSSYQCSTEGAPWALQQLDCALDTPEDWYYTDSTNVGTATGPTNALLDQGQFFGVSYLCANSTDALGEIYVVYDVELKDPQPNAGNVGQAIGNTTTVTTGFSTNFPVFVTVASTTSIVVTFTSPGRYLLNWNSLSATAVPNVGTGVGVTATTNSAQVVGVATVTNTANLGTFTLSAWTGMGNWTLYATRLPPFPISFA